MEYSEDGSLISHSTIEWMNSGFGLTDKSNAWAGPDHWKYRNPKGTWHSLQLTRLKHPWPLLSVQNFLRVSIYLLLLQRCRHSNLTDTISRIQYLVC